MSTFARSLPATQIRPPRSSLLPKINTVLSWLFAVPVLFILAVPALVLFVFTGVPTLISVVLVFVDVALIVALFRLDRSLAVVGGVMAGFAIVSIVAIFLSQIFAATPPIADAQGKPLVNSIAVLEEVNLNGAEQWITIRGKNINNPILLNLGMGGPGGGGFATRTLFEPLEEHFVVVSWDEPGTGKSYNAVPVSSLKPQRFVDDAHALTQLLRERFHQDKIFVYGVSWTSILGIWLIQQHPGDYYAFISSGQMVNTTENDVMGYELALNYSIERGDDASVEALRRNGPPPYSGDGLLGKYVTYLDILNDYMGEPRYMIVAPLVPFFAPEYGLIDRVNHTRGSVDSFTVVYPQLKDLDFTLQANKLDVPVYFLVGRQDVNAMAELVERYYDILQAPHKELIWLDGGHGLSGENLDQFTDVMVNKVLANSMSAP
jgi:pimeloyl-ACP methyl ester carboxylesterase